MRCILFTFNSCVQQGYPQPRIYRTLSYFIWTILYFIISYWLINYMMNIPNTPKSSLTMSGIEELTGDFGWKVTVTSLKGQITSYTFYICSGNRKWDPIGVSDEVIEEIKDYFIRNLYWASSDNILRSFIILWWGSQAGWNQENLGNMS